uniref:Uncharacterized protein n=1 Tax=Anguilla anguilla TaxID=7936 RepID=A0A0E9P9V1_ANGAN
MTAFLGLSSWTSTVEILMAVTFNIWNKPGDNILQTLLSDPSFQKQAQKNNLDTVTEQQIERYFH